jgi:hypothetical protein
MNESQYRVGRYGAIGDAASRVSSSDEHGQRAQRRAER